MCGTGDRAGMVVREEPCQEDQSLCEIALYPSEGCLVKMLYRAGFAVHLREPGPVQHLHQASFARVQSYFANALVLLAGLFPHNHSGSVARPAHTLDRKS